MIKELTEDYARHGGANALVERGFYALAVYRLGRAGMERKGLRGWAIGRAYRVLSAGVQLGFGVALPREAKIGDGFVVVHGNGVRVHPDAVIGDRCTLMHEVSIGETLGRAGVPRIGNDVFIGAGAKVLGPIEIGDGALIAANSLVIADVPAGRTAMGVPARLMPTTRLAVAGRREAAE